MKKFLFRTLMFIGFILIGTIVNYFCIPLYVDLCIMKPAILTDTIVSKWLISLMISYLPWLFMMLCLSIISIVIILGFEIWSHYHNL